MKRTFRFIAGYLIGITVFLYLIPLGFFQLSRLDYLLDYKMLISSMVGRLAIAGLLMILGSFFMIWSNVWLFIAGKGGPADAMGVAISPRTQKLVTRGPYRYCRHPMVFGALTVYLSLVIYMNSFFALAVLILFCFLIVIFLRRSEEKRLMQDFGDEYLKYRNAVPMLIPIKLRKK